MKLEIKKGATVEVIAGSDKGKKGKVVEVLPKKMLVKVQGARIATHFDKKDGIKKEEGYLHYSNLKLIEKNQESKSKKGSKKKTVSK
jgi:large subunit ribosomal protein L24